MLVITRKVNQRIRIGPDASLLVIGISRDIVRLAIEAPREVPIRREEIYVKEKGPGAARAASRAALTRSTPRTAER